MQEESIFIEALEKDRNRRYETASGLPADLRRYLDDEPVQACPPSARYRFRKFARRNRVALAMASVVATALFAVGLAGALAYRNRVTEQRRLAEQRQNALKMALMAAMSGDFDAADKGTDEAEVLGASTAQLRLLRGQVAFYRGDMEAASRHSEQATKLLPVGKPGAVAARAILALACANTLQSPRFVALALELDQLSPVTAEDFLFKGQAEAMYRPERSLQTIDESIRRRDAVVARIARTDARANHAQLMGELRSAESALDDALVIRGMQPNNPFVLGRLPVKLCEAHWEIGLWRLSTGDRAGAQDHWRKCVATWDFENWAWLWARAFLNRMQKDPAWPPWIPRIAGGQGHDAVSDLKRSARAAVPL
jgi:hypothetical protein